MEINNQDLMKSIQIKFQSLTKGQKLIAEYILKHYDKATFKTAAKMSISIGVCESTVVRFAIELGFSNYTNLQKALQNIIRNKLTALQRIELSNDFLTQKNTLKNVLEADMKNIRSTLEKIDQHTFEKIVDLLLKARKIYVIGLRGSSTLAEFLGFNLNLILDNVEVVSYGTSEEFEQMVNVNEQDIVIGIGFPKYTLRTIEALAFAKFKNACIVAITDSLLSPLAGKSDYTLIAQSNITFFVDSLIAPLSVINALIIAVGLRKKEKITSKFSTLNNIWEEY